MTQPFRIADASLAETYDRQRNVVSGLDELRARLFAELIALQRGEVTIHHANAAAALGRQIQQTCEVQVRLIREFRNDLGRVEDDDEPEQEAAE